MVTVWPITWILDGDGVANHLDLDSDGDGIADLSEVGGEDLNGDGLVDSWTDSDGDGIVDSVDVDVTGGEDADGDGIDDFADADFIFADDTDGDGIIDLFDEDFLGSGFLPIVVGGEVVSPGNFPDIDSNGVADVLEANGPAAALPDNGVILTGLAGSGATGPLMPLILSALSLIGLASRRRSNANQ